MDRINHLVIDSTQTITDLCVLATEFPTDKSPYCTAGGQSPHRHPYTAIYDLLFGGRRFDPLVLGELGILDNMSMHVWRAYFPQATLFGFDVFAERIEKAKADCLPNTHYALADVTSRPSLFAALNGAQRRFDILIDDSTHLFDHQVAFVGVAVEFVKPGGFLVVEDVFRGWEESRYCEALQPYYRYFASGVFIEAEHVAKFSEGRFEPYYDNDKLLVLVRNQTPIERHHPGRAENLAALDQALAQPSFVARGTRPVG